MKFPGGTGDIGFTAPKRPEKVQKRLDRADKLGTPDPFDPDYDKKVIKPDKRRKFDKKFSSAFQTPKKSDLKKLDKQPGGYRAPVSGFGKGITPGQFRSKQLDAASFIKTQPSDIKLPQTFKDFGKKLRRYRSDVQDFKDKDIATMRTGKSSSKVKVSGANNLSRQDVGMAPPDTPPKIKKSTPQKGVSAIETTKKYNQEKNLKKFEKFRKEAETAKNKYRADVQKTFDNKSLTGSEKAKQSRELMKKVKTAQNFERGYKSNPTSAVIRTKDLKTVTSAAKGPKPDVIKYTGVTAKGNPSRAIKPFAKITCQATIKDIAKQKGPLKQLKNYKYYAGAKKLAAKSPIAKKAIVGAGRVLGSLGTRGRIAAGALSFIPTLAANPGVRSFVRNTAIFGTAAAALGLAKPKQNVLKVGKGVTKTTNLPSKFQPKNAKNLSYVDAYGKKRKLESGDVRFKFGLTGTKKNKDGTVTPGGMQYNKQDMARVKNIQKKYIDSYNASVKGNPFKKQIKYKVEKDGSYTVTPPKKK